MRSGLNELSLRLSIIDEGEEAISRSQLEMAREYAG
jgi:hypothetical protein